MKAAVRIPRLALALATALLVACYLPDESGDPLAWTRAPTSGGEMAPRRAAATPSPERSPTPPGVERSGDGTRVVGVMRAPEYILRVNVAPGDDSAIVSYERVPPVPTAASCATLGFEIDGGLVQYGATQAPDGRSISIVLESYAVERLRGAAQLRVVACDESHEAPRDRAEILSAVLREWGGRSDEATAASGEQTSAGGTPSSGGPVQVRGYNRSNGTYVAPYSRSAPHYGGGHHGGGRR